MLLKTSLTRLHCKNLNFQKKLIRPIFLVISGVLYFFSLYSQKLTRSYSRNAARTLLFCGGRFRLYISFFQEAQNYADGKNIVEIFMEVSALTGKNVKDLFSEIGE